VGTGTKNNGSIIFATQVFFDVLAFDQRTAFIAAIWKEHD
jgi:hypothetical protein